MSLGNNLNLIKNTSEFLSVLLNNNYQQLNERLDLLNNNGDLSSSLVQDTISDLTDRYKKKLHSFLEEMTEESNNFEILSAMLDDSILSNINNSFKSIKNEAGCDDSCVTSKSSSDSCKIEPSVSPKIDIINETPMNRKTIDDLKFYRLTQDSTYDIQVAHVKSPLLFWVHLTESLKVLPKLIFELNEFYNNQSISELYTIENYSNNLICAAKYTANDLWLRAAVYDVDHKKQMAAVYFLDYGLVEKLPFDRLRILNDEFFEYKVLAVPVTLLNVFPNDYEDKLNAIWSDENKNKFARIIQNQKGKIETIYHENWPIFLVDLKLNLPFEAKCTNADALTDISEFLVKSKMAKKGDTKWFINYFTDKIQAFSSYGLNRYSCINTKIQQSDTLNSSTSVESKSDSDYMSEHDNEAIGFFEIKKTLSMSLQKPKEKAQNNVIKSISTDVFSDKSIKDEKLIPQDNNTDECICVHDVSKLCNNQNINIKSCKSLSCWDWKELHAPGAQASSLGIDIVPFVYKFKNNGFLHLFDENIARGVYSQLKELSQLYHFSFNIFDDYSLHILFSNDDLINIIIHDLKFIIIGFMKRGIKSNNFKLFLEKERLSITTRNHNSCNIRFYMNGNFLFFHLPAFIHANYSLIKRYEKKYNLKFHIYTDNSIMCIFKYATLMWSFIDKLLEEVELFTSKKSLPCNLKNVYSRKNGYNRY